VPFNIFINEELGDKRSSVSFPLLLLSFSSLAGPSFVGFSTISTVSTDNTFSMQTTSLLFSLILAHQMMGLLKRRTIIIIKGMIQMNVYRQALH
jgi:hypothetical protein